MKIIECPRDAMQSIKKFIPTEKKIKYIQNLSLKFMKIFCVQTKERVILRES